MANLPPAHQVESNITPQEHKNSIFITYSVYGLIAILFMYSLLALGRNFTNTLNPSLGGDIFSYWFPLQLVRQNMNPYVVMGSELWDSLRYPLYFLDSSFDSSTTFSSYPSSFTAANTPTMLFVLYPLGLFSWPTAKLIWLFCNLIFTLSIVILTIKIFKPNHFLTMQEKLIFFLIVMSLLPTRNTIGNGQTTLFIVASSLLAVYVCMYVCMTQFRQKFLPELLWD